MIEKILKLVADTIGGNLVVCDDGFVIEKYAPLRSGKNRSERRD